MGKIPEWDWKIQCGTIEKRQLVLFEKAEVTRITKVEVYDPNVWAIDGEGDKAGPKDIALTKACKLFMREITPKKATYRSRVESMYKLISTYKKLNGGTGDTFVREAFLPWLDKVEVCTGVNVHVIWEEVMGVKG